MAHGGYSSHCIPYGQRPAVQSESLGALSKSQQLQMQTVFNAAAQILGGCLRSVKYSWQPLWQGVAHMPNACLVVPCQPLSYADVSEHTAYHRSCISPAAHLASSGSSSIRSYLNNAADQSRSYRATMCSLSPRL
eukprot:GHUV01031964.1.p1 GENE.GHUV01031964.1~~GHUV01031964.1.p1  ORF type:complete len:135 (-),score=20.36 GHUV01031964.1:487-891(-)